MIRTEKMEISSGSWKRKSPFDMLIHLGDAEGSEQYIAHWAEPGCELEMVLGNNDFFSHLERERDLMIRKIQNAFNPWPLLSCVFKHRVFKKKRQGQEILISLCSVTPTGLF